MTIAIEHEACYRVQMEQLFDLPQPQWRSRVSASRAFLPLELVRVANEMGRIYADVIGKPARTIRIVIEDDDEISDEMRFELD
jgi:hypothetical protein